MLLWCLFGGTVQYPDVESDLTAIFSDSAMVGCNFCLLAFFRTLFPLVFGDSGFASYKVMATLWSFAYNRFGYGALLLFDLALSVAFLFLYSLPWDSIALWLCLLQSWKFHYDHKLIASTLSRPGLISIVLFDYCKCSIEKCNGWAMGCALG